MKPLEVRVLPSGYAIEDQQFRTVRSLEAELRRRMTRDARVVPAVDATYRKVAAAVRCFQRLGIGLGIVGYVRDEEH